MDRLLCGEQEGCEEGRLGGIGVLWCFWGENDNPVCFLRSIARRLGCIFWGSKTLVKRMKVTIGWKRLDESPQIKVDR